MTDTKINLQDQPALFEYLTGGIDPNAATIDSDKGTVVTTKAEVWQTILDRLNAMNSGYLYDTSKELGDNKGETWLTTEEATAIKIAWENSKVGPHSEKIVPAAFEGASKALRNILVKAGLVRGVEESSRKREAGQVHRNLTTRMPVNFGTKQAPEREVMFTDTDGDRLTLHDCIFLPKSEHAKLLQQVNAAITAANAAPTEGETDAGTTGDAETGGDDRVTTGGTGTDESTAPAGESELIIPTDPSKVSDSITKVQAKEMLSILREVIKWRADLKPGQSYAKPDEKADQRTKTIYEAFTKFKNVSTAKIKTIGERLDEIIKATPEGENIEIPPPGNGSWSAKDYVFWGAIGLLAIVTGLIIRARLHSPRRQAESAPAVRRRAPGRSGDTMVIDVDRDAVDNSPLTRLKAKLGDIDNRGRVTVKGAHFSHWTDAKYLKNVTTIYQIAEISNESASVVLDMIKDQSNVLLIIGNVERTNVGKVCFAIFKDSHPALDKGIITIYKKDDGKFYYRTVTWGNINQQVLEEKAAAAARARKPAGRSSNVAGQVADELANRGAKVDAALRDPNAVLTLAELEAALDDPQDTVPLRREDLGEAEAPAPAAEPEDLDFEPLTLEEPDAGKTIIQPAVERVLVVANAADQRAKDNLNAQRDVIAEFAAARPNVQGIGELTNAAAIAQSTAEVVDALRTGLMEAQLGVTVGTIRDVLKELGQWRKLYGIKKGSVQEMGLILSIFDHNYPKPPSEFGAIHKNLKDNFSRSHRQISARMETYNAVTKLREDFAKLQAKSGVDARAGINSLAKKGDSYTHTVAGKPQTFKVHFFIDGNNAGAKVYFVDESVFNSDEGARETLTKLAGANHPVILIVGDGTTFRDGANTMDILDGLLGKDHPASNGSISEIVTKATPPAPAPAAPKPAAAAATAPERGDAPPPLPKVTAAKPAPETAAPASTRQLVSTSEPVVKPAPAPMTLTLEQVLQLMKDFYQSDETYRKAHSQLTFEINAAVKPEDILNALIEKQTGPLASDEDRDNFRRVFNRQYNFSTTDANTRFVRQLAVLMEALATGKDPLDPPNVTSIRAAAVAKANAIQNKMRADAMAARVVPAAKTPPTPDRQPWTPARRGEPTDPALNEPAPAAVPATPKTRTEAQSCWNVIHTELLRVLMSGPNNGKYNKYLDKLQSSGSLKALLRVTVDMLQAEGFAGIYDAWNATLDGGPDHTDIVQSLALCIKIIEEKVTDKPGTGKFYLSAAAAAFRSRVVDTLARGTFKREVDAELARQAKSAAPAKPAGTPRPAGGDKVDGGSGGAGEKGKPTGATPAEDRTRGSNGRPWYEDIDGPGSGASGRAGTPRGPIRPPVMVKPGVRPTPARPDVRTSADASRRSNVYDIRPAAAGPQCAEVLYEGGVTYADGSNLRVAYADPVVAPTPPVGANPSVRPTSARPHVPTSALLDMSFTDFVKSLYSNNRQFYETVLSHSPEQQLKDILLRMKALAKTDPAIKALYEDVSLTYEFIKAFNHENPGFFKEPEVLLNLFVRSRFKDAQNPNLRTLTADQFVAVYATRREAELQATRRVERETLALRGNLRRGMERLEHILREAERIRRR